MDHQIPAAIANNIIGNCVSKLKEIKKKKRNCQAMETDLWLKLSLMEPDQITFQEDNLGKDNGRYHSYCLHEKNYDLFLNVLLFKNL